MRRTRSYEFEAPAAAPAAASALSGLEFLRRQMAGEVPRGSMLDTFAIRLVLVEPGRVVVEAVPEEFAYNNLGSVHGGFAATLLDTAMGCAVHSTVARALAYTTVDLTLNFVRPISGATGLVRGEGKVVHAGRRVATAEGRLMAADGRLLAHGLTTCLIFAAGEGAGAA